MARCTTSWAWMVVACALMAPACAKKTPPPAGPEVIAEETDDDSARPECWPDCQTAKWYQTDIQVVLHEVTRCASGPVMVSEDLAGQVSVQFENVSCREALARVLKAAGLQTRKVSVVSNNEQQVEVDALLVTGPGQSMDRLVATAVPPFRRAVRSGPGIIEGGPMSDWERAQEERERERAMEVDPDRYWAEWRSDHHGRPELDFSNSQAPSADPKADAAAAEARAGNSSGGSSSSDYDSSGNWKSPFDPPPRPRMGVGGPFITVTPVMIPYTTWRIIRYF